MTQAARPLRWAAAALLVALAAHPAAAFDYPNRPVTLIVSHKAGGPSDVIARVLGRMLSPVLRQPLVIENRPGAAGNIAAEHVAHAVPDGYTLLMGNTSILATNAARKSNLSFDPKADFAPVTLIGTQANVLVVTPSLPAQNLTQLIELAKGRPGLLSYASAGHGSPSHLAGELFKIEAKINLLHVPYTKPAPALQDVVAGHVNMMFAPASVVVNHVRAGRVRVIGLATPKPSPLLPAAETLSDLGLTGFDATTWYGLVAPAGTPKEVIDVLYHSTATVLEDEPARNIMARLGIEVVASSPKEFETYVAAQIPKWSTVLKSLSGYGD